ncbi:MAG: tetraacyldisaccharide 4'-kinase [Betaproteobacteria bacterium]
MPYIRPALQQAWLSKSLLACVLWPVSLIYGAIVSFRKLLYRLNVFHAQNLPVPVIVVGNVFVGGVGKTPLVIALVKQLTEQGLKVGVLSRGYGRSGDGSQSVTAQSSATEVGDEPVLIARACQVPVFVGKNRFQTGQHLLAQNPHVQLIVCDDGLQHLALAHDLALCVFDERGLGNGWLLPAGPLREPWPVDRSGYSQVITLSTSNYAIQNPERVNEQVLEKEEEELQMQVLEKDKEQPKELKKPKADFLVPRVLADFAQQADGTTQALSIFQGQKVQALAGIGKPQVFFDMLTDIGIALSATKALADHDDMRSIHIDPEMGEVLCTEKDAVKLWNFQPTAWAVPLVTEIPKELLNTILAHIGPKLSSAHGHKTS